MTISGTITLGTDTTSNMTSFDLYPCTSSSNSSCSGTAFETNVSRTTLIGGFQTNNIPDGTLYIKINSTNTGPCKDANPAIIELSGAPLQVSLSPTPTLTKTPTQTPTQTPTPTSEVVTPSYYSITVNLVGNVGQNGNLQIYQSSDGISYQSSLTLTSTDGNFATTGFNGTPGYWYKLMVARTFGGVGMNDKLNLYTQVYDINYGDFNPGPISNAWCANSGNTLESDPFQLPNPIQNRQSIIFYGGLNEGCL